jgi:hypothetical protein
MKFRLNYTGPLPSSSKTPHHKAKMAIRRAVHVQLKELWKIHPLLKHFDQPAYDPITRGTGTVFPPQFELGHWNFLPLVNRKMDLVCAVDVLMFRRQEPGGIIKNTGDIDNQLTTLFDALRMPIIEKELADEQPTNGERPLYCLLEDDSLIVRESVDTDRLLEPLGTDSEVRLVIQVSVKATRLTGENRLFVGYDVE